MDAINSTFKYTPTVSAPVNPLPPSQNKPAIRTGEDEFVNTKEQSKKINTKTAVIAGAVLAAVVGTGLILRGKFKKASQLAENIVFKPAQSMDEAVKFAKENLKISSFDTEGDLEIANWVNEGLTTLSNKYKGKMKMPVAVTISDSLNENSIAGMLCKEKDSLIPGDMLIINKKSIDTIKNEAIETLKELGAKVDEKDGKKILHIYSAPFFSTDKMQDIAKYSSRAIEGKSTKIEDINLLQTLNDYAFYINNCSENPLAVLEDLYTQSGFSKKLQEKMTQGEFISIEDLRKLKNDELYSYFKKAYAAMEDEGYTSTLNSSRRSIFHSIFHEIGHAMHHKNTPKNYLKMYASDKGKDGAKEIGGLAKEFLGSKEEQAIASKVSHYKSSPLEFVAETYSMMLNGSKFSDDVMDLYYKYGGPKIPA